MRTIRVSKLDAAQHQLETAVELYFNDQDPISVHTLTAAGYEIVKDLSKKSGNLSAIDFHLVTLDAVDKKLAKEIRKELRKPQNFFKHADDPAESSELNFDPKVSEGLLFEAVRMLLLLSGSLPVRLEIYVYWFGLHHPDYFVNAPTLHNLFSMSKKALGDGNRKSFFEEFLATAATRMVPKGST